MVLVISRKSDKAREEEIRAYLTSHTNDPTIFVQFHTTDFKDLTVLRAKVDAADMVILTSTSGYGFSCDNRFIPAAQTDKIKLAYWRLGGKELKIYNTSTSGGLYFNGEPGSFIEVSAELVNLGKTPGNINNNFFAFNAHSTTNGQANDSDLIKEHVKLSSGHIQPVTPIGAPLGILHYVDSQCDSLIDKQIKEYLESNNLLFIL